DFHDTPYAGLTLAAPRRALGRHAACVGVIAVRQLVQVGLGGVMDFTRLPGVVGTRQDGDGLALPDAPAFIPCSVTGADACDRVTVHAVDAAGNSVLVFAAVLIADGVPCDRAHR